jgi:hypothetical protein
VRGSGLKIVISYAREDSGTVQELVETLRLLGHEPWTDAGAHSGGRWWDEIVRRIQQCDILLAATSPASQSSRACTLERRYALALNKVLLPVLVAPINMRALPSEMAQIHFFDYTVRTPATAAKLYQTLRETPPPRPLPRPLPLPPPPPLSYLNDIADQLGGLPPDLDRQHQIVTALTHGLRSSDSEERSTAIELLRRYVNHPHRLPDPDTRARQALAELTGGMASPPPGLVAAPPAERSKAATVLAWIGGLAIASVVFAIWISSSNSTPSEDPTPASPSIAVDGADGEGPWESSHIGTVRFSDHIYDDTCSCVEVRSIPAGAKIRLICVAQGASITKNGRSSSTWYQVEGGYVPDVVVATSSRFDPKPCS